MKALKFILLFVPVLAIGQYDFENRFVKIDAISLPELDEISNIAFYKSSNIFTTKLRTFQMNASNYRQPVDMMTALEGQQQYVDTKFDATPEIKERTFGFSVSVNGSNSFDNTTTSGGLRNTVYQEMRPILFCQRSGLNLLNN